MALGYGRVSSNQFACAKFIVDTNGLDKGATHTTIAGALSDASSGETIFIRPGTYTENLTLKAGVNLTSFVGDADRPNVTIIGNCTATFAGRCMITGIRLQTNSAEFLTVSGSSATSVFLENCYLNCTNNTGISFTSSDASSEIKIIRCFGNIATTGIGLFSHSGSGSFSTYYTFIGNTGATTTSSTISGTGSLYIDYSIIGFPITCSSTSVSIFRQSNLITANANTTALIQNSTDNNNTVRHCHFAVGSASAISIGASAVLNCHASTFDSSNATTITGSGTLRYSDLAKAGDNSTFTLGGSLSLIQRGLFPGYLSFDGGTNTLSVYESAAFPTAPALQFGGASTGITYSTQQGYYTRIGSLVYFNIRLILTSKGTATGSATVANFPYASANNNAYNNYEVNLVSVTATAGSTEIFASHPLNSSSINLVQRNPAVPSLTLLSDTNFANNSELRISGCYGV